MSAAAWLPLALLLCVLLPVFACSHESSAAPSKPPITIDPDVYAADHPELFKIAKAETRALPSEVTANGTVNPDVNRTIHVTSLGTGRVTDLRVKLGDAVHKGQALLGREVIQ